MHIFTTPLPIGTVIGPLAPGDPVPRRRRAHKNPNGEIVWIVDSTIIAPNSDVTIEPGVQLGFYVMLSGTTTVAAGAELGNSVEILDGTVEEDAHVGDDTVIEGGIVKKKAQVGQDNRIEKGGVVGERAYTGTGYLVEEGQVLEPDSVNEYPAVSTGS